METHRSDEALRGSNGHVVLEPPKHVSSAAPSWARDGLEVVGRGPQAGVTGTLRASRVYPNCWIVDARGAVNFWSGEGREIADAWRPAEQPPQDVAEPSRPLVEIMGAVLHELRSSGPHGLYLDELEERIGVCADAVSRLCDEGRVVVRDRRFLISEAQVELDATRRDLSTMAAEAGFFRDHANVARHDGAAWRSLALELLGRLFAPERREDSAGATEDVGARPNHLGVRLHALALKLAASAVAGSVEARDAYALGVQDAGWIASHGGPAPPALPVARIITASGIAARCAVLSATPFAGRGFLLSSPGTGRVLLDLEGKALSGAPFRLHPEDLAALRGDGAPALAGSQTEGR